MDKAGFSRIGKSNVRRSKEHERRVATLFTEWTGVKFRRRRVEGRDDAVRVVEAVADVIPVSGDINFAIECKCEKGFSFDALLNHPANCVFTEWYHQASYDADLYSTTTGRTIWPLVFFKPIPAWDWVAFPLEALTALRPRHGTWSGGGLPEFPHLFFDAFAHIGPVTCNVSHSKKHKNLVTLHLLPVIICRWSDFTLGVDPWSIFSGLPRCEGAATLEPTSISTVEKVEA